MDDDENDNEDDDDDDVYDDVVLKVPSGTPMVPGSDQEVITRARKSFPERPFSRTERKAEIDPPRYALL